MKLFDNNDPGYEKKWTGRNLLLQYAKLVDCKPFKEDFVRLSNNYTEIFHWNIWIYRWHTFGFQFFTQQMNNITDDVWKKR